MTTQDKLRKVRDDLPGCGTNWQAMNNAITQLDQQEITIAGLVNALGTLAAQDSGIVGSTNKADCMAVFAKIALTKARESEANNDK